MRADVERFRAELAEQAPADVAESRTAVDEMTSVAAPSGPRPPGRGSTR
jgi:hypothetical protein